MRYFKILFFLIPIALATELHAVEGDRDNDGVTDAFDLCPDTAQLKRLPADFKYAAAVNQERLKRKPAAYPVDANGCEFDSDGDGVVNSKDYCPENSKVEISMGVAGNGCPMQSDGDGTPDYRDHCPDTPRHVAADRYGCPKGG